MDLFGAAMFRKYTTFTPSLIFETTVGTSTPDPRLSITLGFYVTVLFLSFSTFFITIS